MKKIIKQVVGIDVAQKELVTCIGRLRENLELELYASRTFKNTQKGFEALVLWAKKLSDDIVPVKYVMEATGVYHQSFAYFLDEKGYETSVILPNKISNYMRTLTIKTVTDKTSSEAIARFGLERQLDNWHRPKEIYRDMRQLTRERDQLVAERTMVKNQLHAEEAEAYPNKNSVARIKERIKMINKQVSAIGKEIAALIQTDDEVKEGVTNISSLPGVGILTSAIILAETNGFELTHNRRQVASYAGFDVKCKDSGTSVKGQRQISKRGNKYLRKAMHLPALAAIRHDDRFKTIFRRLVEKHGIKMKAAVAVHRKLLEMAYTLYKTKTKYDESYLSKQNKEADVQENEVVLA